MRAPVALLALLAVSCSHSERPKQTLPPNAVPPHKMTTPATTPLIPRRDFFAAPDHDAAKVSPDGTSIAWLGPDSGVPNIFIAPVRDPLAAKALTHLTGRGIRSFSFARDDKHIIYVVDRDGDENWHLVVLDIATGATKDATPYPGARASIIAAGDQHRGSILIGLNKRDPEVEDVYELDLAKASLKLVFENHERLVDFDASDDRRTLVAEHWTDDGGKELVAVDLVKRKSRVLMAVKADDTETTGIISISADGKTLYFKDSRGRDTSALTELDLASGKSRMVADSDRVDVGDVVLNPTTHAPRLVYFEYETVMPVVTESAIASDLTVLRGERDGRILWSASRDDKIWVVSIADAKSPERFYVYDRDARELHFAFSRREALAEAALGERRAVVIPARDGEKLLAYLTVPAGTEEGAALPLVLYVHGGPWTRDREGYDANAAWLADRSYAVLQVNYRGSAGFGKRFVGLANRGWGGVMHDDLVDAVAWAVKSGIADSERIGIYGGSYGGYATLVGLTATPTLFRCGIDLVGISSLETFIATIPAYWKPFVSMIYQRVGDPRTPEGASFLRERSPLSHTDAIERPLLVAQGANDPRVKRAESDQLVEALVKRGVPVTYLLFPDEGHGLARQENRLAFSTEVESFLAEHLGGRAEPADPIPSTSTMQRLTPKR